MPITASRERTLGWILLGGAMAAATALLFWLQRDLAFADDSFNWIAISGLGPSSELIKPYGGHLIFIPLVIFKLGLDAFGASYTGFGVIQVGLLLILSGLVYEYGRRRVGPLLALPAAVVILFLGSSWNVLLQPMLGIQFLCALVPGVAALLALEREDRRGDIAACVLLVLATWSFEVGLAFLAGAVVGVFLSPDRRRRAWIVAIPAVAYLIWRAWASKYGDSGIDISNVIWIPAYAVDSLADVAVSLFGRFYWVGSGQLTYLKLSGFDLDHLAEGLVLLAIEAVVLFLVVRAVLRRGPLPTTFWVAATVLVTLWVEQGLALAPDRTPGEIRYILPDTVVFLLFAVEAARGVRATRLALAIAVVLTAAAVVGNAPRLKEGRDTLTEYSEPAKAAIAVVELGGQRVNPDFNAALDAPEAFKPGREAYVGASSIQAMSTKFGPFGYSIEELKRAPEEVRESADLVAARALGLGLTPAPRGACRAGAAASDSVTLPPGGAVIVARRRTSLLLGRFGDRYFVDLGQLQPGVPVTLRIPADEAEVPWRVHGPTSAGLASCPL